MRLVHPDDAGVVHHLDQDHDRVVGLHDALHVVVEHREHRGAGGGPEPHEAAFGMGALLGVVVGAGRVEAVIEPPRGAVVGPREPGAGRPGRAGAVGQGRLPAVRRVGDDRRADQPVDAERGVSAIDPEGVVAADVPGRAARPVAADGRRRPASVAGLEPGSLPLGAGRRPLVRAGRGQIEHPGQPVGVRRDDRRLLLGQRQAAAELPRPLQRGHGGRVVDAGQVGPAGRRAGNAGTGLGRRGGRSRRPDEGGGAETEDDSTDHRMLLPCRTPAGPGRRPPAALPRFSRPSATPPARAGTGARRGRWCGTPRECGAGGSCADC